MYSEKVTMAIGNFATGPAPFSQKTLTALTRPSCLHAVAKAKQKQRQETGRSDKIQSLAHPEMHLQSREHPSAGPGTPSSGSGNAPAGPGTPTALIGNFALSGYLALSGN